MIIIYQSMTELDRSRHRGLMRAYGENAVVAQLAPDPGGRTSDAKDFLSAAAAGRKGFFSFALPGPLLFSRWRSVADINRRWALGRLLARLRRVSDRRIVVVLQLPQLMSTGRELDCDALIYEVRDEYIGLQRSPELRELTRRRQFELLLRADAVFATSNPLVDDLRSMRPDVARIRQGVDTVHFRPVDPLAPKTTASGTVSRIARKTGRPCIGVAGILNQRVDWPLLSEIAELRQDWDFVVLGPFFLVSDGARREIDSFLERRNVEHWAPVPEEEMAAKLACFDVGLVPYRSTPTTRRMNPLKAYQYLACGLPVVATRLPGLVDLDGWVRMGEGAAEITQAIEEALSGEPEPTLVSSRDASPTIRPDPSAARSAAMHAFDYRQVVGEQMAAFEKSLILRAATGGSGGVVRSFAPSNPQSKLAIVYQGVVTHGVDRNHALLRGYAERALTVRVAPDTLSRRQLDWKSSFAPLERALARGGKGLVLLTLPNRWPFGAIGPIAQSNRLNALDSVLERLRRAGYRTVLGIQHPSLLPGVEGLSADLKVYEVQDDYVGLKPEDVAQRDNHRRLVEQSDLVLATSEHLFEPIASMGADVVLTSNGVDFASFSGSSVDAAPAVLRALARPRVGLLGNLNSRIDWRLLEEIAERRRDWQLVLIGPLYMADEESAASAERLTQKDNVHVLGSVPEATMASCMKCFDVGLIPYRLNRVTRSINPLKVYQYLACGLPVVATALPSLRSFGDMVSVADPEDVASDFFVSAIDAELDGVSPDERERRRQDRLLCAARFDWGAIAERQLEIFRDRLGLSKSPA